MRKILLIVLLLVIGIGVLWLVESPYYFFGNNDSVETGSLTVKQISVYDGVDVPKDIKVLDLSGSDLTGSLKAEIWQLSELRVLNLSDNEFTGIPAEIGRLHNLQIIDLSNNPITGLPYEIGDLPNLKSIDLTNTQYAEQDLVVIRERLPDTVEIITD